MWPEPADLLWDVVEEHYDEAQYGLNLFERTLRSPNESLADLAEYPEARLLAHIDGLAVARRAGRERILLPALTEPDPAAPEQIVASVLACVAAGHLDAVLPAVLHEDPAVRAAAARGCQLSDDASLGTWAFGLLARASTGIEQLALLELLAHLRVQPPPLMEELQSDDAELRAAAAGAALHGDSKIYGSIFHYLCSDTDPRVAEQAILGSLAWGASTKLSSLHEMGVTRPNRGDLLSLYAALGTREDHEVLHKELTVKPELKCAYLRAFGFSGNIAFVPVLLEHVQSGSEIEAKTAALSLSLIAGIDLALDSHIKAEPVAPVQNPLPSPEEDAEAQASLPPLEEDDLEADLVPQPEQDLPTPDGHAIELWWRNQASRFDPKTRYLFGAPYTSSSVLASLQRAPLSLRHVVARAFGVRAGRPGAIDTTLFSTAQRRQLAAVEKLSPVRFLQW